MQRGAIIAIIIVVIILLLILGGAAYYLSTSSSPPSSSFGSSTSSIDYTTPAAGYTEPQTTDPIGPLPGDEDPVVPNITPRPPAPDTSAIVAGKTYKIALASAPTLVFDIKSGSLANGGLLELWTGDGANQKFTYTAAGTFKANHSGRVLDAPRTTGELKIGSQVVQWDAHGGPNQKWTVSDGLITVDGGKYALRAASAKEGAAVNLAATDASDALQQWVFTETTPGAPFSPSTVATPIAFVAGKTYKIALASKPTLVFNVSGASKAAGAPIKLWTANGQPNQKFKYAANKSLKSEWSGLNLDVSGGIAPGKPLVQWTGDGSGANQQFVFDDGLIKVGTLALRASSATAGAPLSATVANKSDALQKWTITAL